MKVYRLKCQLWSDKDSEKYKSKINPLNKTNTIDLKHYIFIGEINFNLKDIENLNNISVLKIRYCRHCQKILKNNDINTDKCRKYIETERGLKSLDVLIDDDEAYIIRVIMGEIKEKSEIETK